MLRSTVSRFLRHQFAGRTFSSSSSSSFDFVRDGDETLESLCERFEEIIDAGSDRPDAGSFSPSESDVNLSGGVLTVVLPPFGTYVINKQTPNRQIWLSSPLSGPARFDFDPERRTWVYSHTKESLHDLLDREISGQVLNNTQKAEFVEKCYLSGKKEWIRAETN